MRTVLLLVLALLLPLQQAAAHGVWQEPAHAGVDCMHALELGFDEAGADVEAGSDADSGADHCSHCHGQLTAVWALACRVAVVASASPLPLMQRVFGAQPPPQRPERPNWTALA